MIKARRIFFVLIVCLASFLASCNSQQTLLQTMNTATLGSTPSLPPPQVNTTRSPGASAAARAFLEAWKQSAYPEMYAMLATESQTSISPEEFTRQYSIAAEEMALAELDYEINSEQVKPYDAQVYHRITFKSNLFGDILRENTLPLVLENGAWKVRWQPSLILPELLAGNYLKREPLIPDRKSIYDRNNLPLATQTDAVAIGLYPDLVNLEEAGGLLSILSRATGVRIETIRGLIENSAPGAYIPLGEVEAGQDEGLLGQLAGYGAVRLTNYNSRFYWSAAAPHVVGYISSIQEGETGEYRRKGYQSFEKVGRKGLEAWAEQTLAGKHGGELYVMDPQGGIVDRLSHADLHPGQDLTSTIDRDLQLAAQKALQGLVGAVVVLEQDTGKVLAMASSPGFNPNAFQTENYNWDSWLSQMANDPYQPQFNRATQGQYPLGSVFKLITIAAALESGQYTPESTYECGYTFDEVPGLPLYDWTYDHFQEDGETQPSGLLTLPQGLIRSCNPYFWHIGLDLYKKGLTKAVSDMARSFGLGSPTGIQGVDEQAGHIPDPQNEVDAVNLAIGQGDTQVTPLQVASFIAALGNGGTLYRPQLVEKITDSEGAETYKFSPEVTGRLPITPENLAIIQEAMQGVVESRSPRGTAYNVFTGFDIPVAGKTGTATLSAGDPHAWFAGYTMAEREDRPDIAIAVIAENGGEGSEIAAPVFRRIVEAYFFGQPLRLYPWEANFYVTQTPTPLFTETATPEP